ANRHDHTFGIGFEETPSGLTGVSGEFFVGGPIVLDFVAGFSVFSPKGNAGSLTLFGIGGAFAYRLRLWDDAALMSGGRLEFEHGSVGSGGALAKPQSYISSGSATQINLMFPVRGEIYFASALSVHAELAAVLALVTDGGGTLGSDFVSK